MVSVSRHLCLEKRMNTALNVFEKLLPKFGIPAKPQSGVAQYLILNRHGSRLSAKWQPTLCFAEI
jgi:hypothetical protein